MTKKTLRCVGSIGLMMMPDQIPISLVQMPGRLDGLFVLEVEFFDPPTEDFDKDLVDLVGHWLGLGASGAFCVEHSSPHQAAMSLKEFSRLNDTRRRWHLAAERCDPRCLRVLRNILVGFSLDVHPLQTIRIDIPGSVGQPLKPLEPVNLGNESELYPEISSELGFPVDWEPSGSPWSYRRFVVQFGEPTSDVIVEAVAALIDHWEWVAVDGFPMTEEDLESGKCSIEDVRTHLFDEYSVETVVGQFGGSEAAWNSLLNSLGSFHRTTQPITRVTIE